MALMIHDTTGTQTDCPRPLSRKKLRQLMPQSSMALTSRALFSKTGRTNRKIRHELAAMEAARKAELEAAESIKAGNFDYKLTPLPEKPKPSLFNRLGKFFSGLQRKAERQSAKGK